MSGVKLPPIPEKREVVTQNFDKFPERKSSVQSQILGGIRGTHNIMVKPKEPATIFKNLNLKEVASSLKSDTDEDTRKSKNKQNSFDEELIDIMESEPQENDLSPVKALNLEWNEVSLGARNMETALTQLQH